MKEKVPEGFEPIGCIMSNFDHTINEDAEEKLKAGKVFGEYTAWNFFAFVWWDGKFKAMIKQYIAHVNTLESNTLQGIMDEACKYYGRG